MKSMSRARAVLVVFGLAIGATVAAADSLEWLENPKGERALAWAREQTRRSKDEIAKSDLYPAILEELQRTLRQSAPSPSITLLGRHAVKFLRDAAHPHGLLQIADRSASGSVGAWRTVLDVDALRKSEGDPVELQWVDAEDSCAPPAFERCLLKLSPRGSDDTELREFDLVSGKFVDGGFRTPVTRVRATWVTPNRIAIAHTVFGSAKTAGGSAAVVRFWDRGSPLESAKPVFEASATDAILQLNGVGFGKDRRVIAMRAIDYSHFEFNLIDPYGATQRAQLPLRLKPFGLLGNTSRHLIVQLAEPATIGGRRLPAEALLAYDAIATPASQTDAARVQVVYLPHKGEYLSDIVVAATANAVNFVVTRSLVPYVMTATPGATAWSVREQFAGKAGQSLRLSGADPVGAQLVVQTTGYLTPARLELWAPGKARTLLQSESAAFDASRFVVEIRSVTAKDGTSIDYYLLRPRDQHFPTPTLMTGYGAFGLTLSPGYLNAGGRAMKVWLDRGGALVVPAVRGGGDRGEMWHQAAIREKRQVSYDDFAAVTEALLKSGFTTPAHLGIFGSSNGGLLAATMGTQRPELFGAVVSDVPLTDMLRFPKMGMGAAWMDEYGNPEDPAAAKVLVSYSPFHNVRQGVKYPPFLISVSTEDNRVGPGHARKLAARLLEVGAPVYFIEDEEGGHGVSDPLTRPEVMAARMTFLIETLMPH